jgi:hypothetical protein
LPPFCWTILSDAMWKEISHPCWALPTWWVYEQNSWSYSFKPLNFGGLLYSSGD